MKNNQGKTLAEGKKRDFDIGCNTEVSLESDTQMEKLSSIPSEKRVQKKEIENPLSDLLGDDVYEKLIENSPTSKAVRDYQIKRRFKYLRNYMSVGDAISKRSRTSTRTCDSTLSARSSRQRPKGGEKE